MTERVSYPRKDSRLYKLRSPGQLAGLMQVETQLLLRLAKGADNYLCWNDAATGRRIEEPKPRLRGIHMRVASLLGRIETPAYLHSAVKGRSYISNANEHDPNSPTAKVDIRKFYPSTRAAAVYHFFADRMLCNGQVAGILARLLTVDGHLATGSGVSPILSYFAYEDMFNEIADLAAQRQCVMTCYVDDMVFTGRGATPRLVHDITQIAGNYRLWAHKTKLFKRGEPKVITGVAVTANGSRVPHNRQIDIARDFDALRAARDEQGRLDVLRRLTGRLHAAAAIDANWRAKALALSSEFRRLQRSMSRDEILKTANSLPIPRPPSNLGHISVAQREGESALEYIKLG